MIKWPWKDYSEEEQVTESESQTENLCVGYGKVMGKKNEYVVDDKNLVIEQLKEYNPRNTNNLTRNFIYKFSIYNETVYANTIQLETKLGDSDKSYKGKLHGQTQTQDLQVQEVQPFNTMVSYFDTYYNSFAGMQFSYILNDDEISYYYWPANKFNGLNFIPSKQFEKRFIDDPAFQKGEQFIPVGFQSSRPSESASFITSLRFIYAASNDQMCDSLEDTFYVDVPKLQNGSQQENLSLFDKQYTGFWALTGGVVLLICLITIWSICCCLKRKKKQNKQITKVTISEINYTKKEVLSQKKLVISDDDQADDVDKSNKQKLEKDVSAKNFAVSSNTGQSLAFNANTFHQDENNLKQQQMIQSTDTLAQSKTSFQQKLTYHSEENDHTNVSHQQPPKNSSPKNWEQQPAYIDSFRQQVPSLPQIYPNGKKPNYYKKKNRQHYHAQTDQKNKDEQKIMGEKFYELELEDI